MAVQMGTLFKCKTMANCSKMFCRGVNLQAKLAWDILANTQTAIEIPQEHQFARHRQDGCEQLVAVFALAKNALALR